MCGIGDHQHATHATSAPQLASRPIGERHAPLTLFHLSPKFLATGN
jgi:hypothetical protein